MTNLELVLVRQPTRANVSLEVVHAQKTAAAALTLAVSASGLEDKEIYLPLAIDAGHWSRIKKGEAGFPPDKTREFCLLVGNVIYPQWIAFQVGCQLVMIQSVAERREIEATKRAEEAEERVKFLLNALAGRAA